MSEPQFRMGAVRLLEAAVALLLVMLAVELWGAYQMASMDPATGQVGPGGTSWSQLAQALVFYTFRGPISLLVASVLLVGIVAALAAPGPVANAQVVRWEAAVLGGVTTLFTLFHLVAGLAALVTMEKNPGEPFDSRVVLSASLGWPAAGLALLALFFLWWLRLADDESGPEGDAVTRDGRPAGGDESDDVARRHDGALADGFRHAEQIAPAERPPAVEGPSPDGSTANGYDEYFRRG